MEKYEDGSVIYPYYNTYSRMQNDLENQTYPVLNRRKSTLTKKQKNNKLKSKLARKIRKQK